MDFSDFSLQQAAEQPREIHLELDGKPLYMQEDKSISDKVSDKPCKVMVLGAGSESVSAIIREIERLEMVANQRFNRAKDRDYEKVALKHQDTMREAMKRLMRAAVCGFENIVYNGEIVEAEGPSIDPICGPRTAFFGQVYEVLLEQHRFLGD